MSKRDHFSFWLATACILVGFLFVASILPVWHRPVNPHAQVDGCSPNKPRTITVPTGVHTAFACPILLSVENMDESGGTYKITIYPEQR